VVNWLTGAQLRAARGLLALSAQELAVEAGLSLRTIRRAEQDNGPVQIKDETGQKIIAVLEARGAIFLQRESGGEGVQLRANPPPVFGNK
jgi:transcriptional regulator with XRE-family HTH domain